MTTVFTTNLCCPFNLTGNYRIARENATCKVNAYCERSDMCLGHSDYCRMSRLNRSRHTASHFHRLSEEVCRDRNNASRIKCDRKLTSFCPASLETVSWEGEKSSQTRNAMKCFFQYSSPCCKHYLKEREKNSERNRNVFPSKLRSEMLSWNGNSSLPVLDQGSLLVLDLHCFLMLLISQHVDILGKTTVLLLQFHYFILTVKVT